MENPYKIFSKEFKKLDLFGSIGEDLSEDVPRMLKWEDWLGPENELVSLIHLRQQEFHDSLVGNDKESKDYWDKLIVLGLNKAVENIPFIEEEDVWYAPNMAAYHAAWTFALMSFYTFKDMVPPKEIEAQWRWFVKGRWPSAIKAGYENNPTEYIVF